MYLEYYGLARFPFQITPDARFFFESRGHKRARATIVYGLSKNEGFVVVTGAVGAGKTTLIEYLMSSGQLDDAMVARISTTQLESQNLLQLIAYTLELPEVPETKAGLLRSLQAFLVKTARRRKRVLMIVDEVQNLSRDSLEELRMLSNFQVGEDSLLQMLLVGQPEFRERLASPACEQIRQRVIASYHLAPLAAEDVVTYVAHRLDAAGAQGRRPFTEAALRRIAEETAGVPRKINRLCDRLLLYGYLEGTSEIDADAVDEVVAETRREYLDGAPEAVDLSGQGGADPAPWRSPPSNAGNGSAPQDHAALPMNGSDQAALQRSVADLRRELAAYKQKVARIVDLVSREQDRLRDPLNRS